MSSCNLGIYGAEQTPVSEATVTWCMLLAALEQFEYQATNRLLLAASEEYGDSGTTQKMDVKKTPAKILPSTLSKHCMCTISIFVVNNHDKQICKLKIRN